mgnify:CR=1 FL=1
MNTLSDEPISNEEEDILKRASFVNNLADSIISWDKEKSLVIGLYGKWGVGKTSILNLTEKKLKESKEPVEIIKFNPWGYSESDDLLNPFVNQISTQLSKNKKNRKLLSLLKRYEALLKLFPSKDSFAKTWSYVILVADVIGINLFNKFPNFIPKLKYCVLFGLALIAILLFFSDTVLKFLSIKWHEEKSLSEIKSNINKKLLSSKKMVIIIDDIDRLSAQEIRQIFRIVKNNADFKNTIYILSFDRDIVENAITIDNKLDGRSYIEKIVNVEYDITEPAQYLLKTYLLKQLEEVIDKLDKKDTICFSEENEKWSCIFQQIIDSLKTIREIKRYVNLLSFKLNQFINRKTLEINLIDYFAIEFIRFKYPDYHNFIHRNKTYFLSEKNSLSYNLRVPNSEDDKWFEKSIAEYTPYEQICLSEIIVWIFPACRYAVNSYYKILAYSTNAGEYDRKKCICSNTFFNIYFEHLTAIDETSVSQYDIDLIKENSKDYETLTRLLKDYISNNKIHNLLKLLESNIRKPEFLDAKEAEILIICLFENADEIPDTPELFSNIPFSIILQCYIILSNFDQQSSLTIFLNILQKCKNIYYPIHFLERQISEYEESSTHVFDKENFELLKNKCIQKINENKEIIITQKHFSILIEIWKMFDENSFNSFKKDFMTKEENILLLFNTMVSVGKINTGITVSHYNAFNYKCMSYFGELEEFKKIAIRIKNVPDIYEKHKLSIDLFLANYERRNSDQLPFFR